MATGLQSWSKTAASNATADSNVNWAEGQSPSSVNDSARSEMASAAKWRDDISGTVTTGGTATAFTMTTNQSFASASAMSGAMLCFIPHATSGASPTLAVDGLTARAINISTGVAVPTGALVIGTPYVVTYIHASTEFIVRGVLGSLLAVSSDAGAGIGPSLDLYRDSASPAASDIIGSIDFNGRDSAANKQLYARIRAAITDATSGSEDASLALQVVIAGTLTSILVSSASQIQVPGGLTVTGDFDVATNKFTVAAASGNTAVAGTLSVTGTIAGSHAAPTIQRFTSGSAQTYTPTAGIKRIRVRMCGGGAGGGAQATNNGTNGNDTSFGDWTAKGGSGGPNGGASTAGGAGGTAGTDGTGTLVERIDGQRGDASTNGGIAVSTRGGPAGFVGLAGSCTTNNATGNTAPTNSGGGGSGGGAFGNAYGGGGGGGEYVEFWMTAAQVGASLTYTVGAAANGGSAGTRAGGNGAAGFIIVEEFYW